MGRKRRLAQVSGHEPTTLLGAIPARELDLHHVRADQAERLVRNLVMTAARSGPGQVVRIITGKGNRSEEGPVLLPLVRRLLETTLAEYVAEATVDRDGGSFLVRLQGG